MRRGILGICALFLLLGGAGIANAAPVVFDFRNGITGSGNNLGTITASGYTLQVQAWTAQFASNWAATQLGDNSNTLITWAAGQGLGVSNSEAGTPELDTNVFTDGRQGYQDWLAFKLVNPPATPVAKYTSVTYSGLDLWQGNNIGEFSQARISTKAGGILQGGSNPLGTTNSTDQLGLATDPETLLLPDNFINGDWYLLVGPRLAGINNSGTGGAGDSFRVAAITMDIAPVPIPGAVWLLGSGLVGLVGLRKRS